MIPEKDFWVCWTLSKLFSLGGLPSLLFKGGTSLSKAFGLIDRFSEDIDISLNRADLGFDGENDPAQISGRNARDRKIQELGQACGRVVRENLVTALDAAIGSVLSEGSYRIEPIERGDGQLDLAFHYPRSLEDDVYGTYVEPSVRLEIGARSDHEPKSAESIQSYAAEHVPSFFTQHECEVIVLAPERTFWEKATIFHSENHRPLTSDRRPPAWTRMSRHAYDLVALDRHGVAATALGCPELLDAVARHKRAFFYARWSRYDEARPGSFKLVPNAALEDALRRDYRDMQVMFMREAPTFDEVMDGLRDLERRINAMPQG